MPDPKHIYQALNSRTVIQQNRGTVLSSEAAKSFLTIRALLYLYVCLWVHASHKKAGTSLTEGLQQQGGHPQVMKIIFVFLFAIIFDLKHISNFN